VFIQHHADRPALLGNTGHLQRGEENLLLLAVMTPVGEFVEKFDDLVQMHRVDSLAGLKPPTDGVQYLKHPFNGPMLRFQRFNRDAHRSP